MRRILEKSLLDLMPDPLPRHVTELHRIISAAGYQCHIVGGCVRDLLLGRRIQDVDLATNARPEVVLRLFRRTVPTGLQHGTVTVLLDGHPYEVTTYRTESEYTDGRRPDRVEYASTLEEDLSRRDFTINALAYEPSLRELVDEHDGQSDLERGLIRTIGRPEDRFFEDGLRPVRACRFRATLGFDIDPATHDAMLLEDVRERMKRVAMERFSDELGKGLRAPHPSRMFDSLQEAQLLDIFLPGALSLPEAFFDYLDLFPDPTFRLALWLDRAVDDPPARMKDLRMSLAATQKIARYCKFMRTLEQFPAQASGPSFWRRLASPIKKELREEAISFLTAARDYFEHGGFSMAIRDSRRTRGISAGVSGALLPGPEEWKDYYRSVEIALKEEPILVTDLTINGHDLQAMGVHGPDVGRILQLLLDRVLENPERNKRHELLVEARVLTKASP